MRRRRKRRTIKTLVLISLAVGALVALSPSTWREAVRDAFGEGNSGATLSGSARIVDGDTLEVRGTRIRLHGIDAPESGQSCRAGRPELALRPRGDAGAHRTDWGPDGLL